MPRCVFAPLLAGLLLALVAPSARAADATDRTTAAHLLALGTPPAAATARPAADEPPLATLLQAHRDQLRRDDDARAAVVRRAWADMHGRPPTEGESASLPREPVLHVELIERLRLAVAAAPADYPAIIHRAYRTVLQRDAYPEELAYWQPRGTLPFLVLVGCVEDWALRNQPGLMSTTGTPTIGVRSQHLLAWRLPPALAAEVRAALPEIFAAPAAGPRLLAPGAAAVATRGGMHLLPVARPAPAAGAP